MIHIFDSIFPTLISVIVTAIISFVILGLLRFNRTSDATLTSQTDISKRNRLQFTLEKRDTYLYCGYRQLCNVTSHFRCAY